MNYRMQNRVNYFKHVLSYALDPTTDSPDVKIEPAESLIQKAVDKIKQKDPNFFKGVSKIVSSNDGSSYGFVESGKDKDPSVIHINFNRIKNEITNKLSSSPQDIKDSAIISAIAEVIFHEHAHVKDYSAEKGFPGGESIAETESKELMKNWAD